MIRVPSYLRRWVSIQIRELQTDDPRQGRLTPTITPDNDAKVIYAMDIPPHEPPAVGSLRRIATRQLRDRVPARPHLAIFTRTCSNHQWSGLVV